MWKCSLINSISAIFLFLPINNSVEALSSERGKVSISIHRSGSKLKILIRDNGNGIPEEILVRLGGPGVTHGKSGTDSGSGLGVYHAKRTIEALSGSFSISSKLGEWTEVEIEIPAI